MATLPLGGGREQVACDESTIEEEHLNSAWGWHRGDFCENSALCERAASSSTPTGGDLWSVARAWLASEPEVKDVADSRWC